MMRGNVEIARELYNQSLLNAMPSLELLTYLNLADLEKQDGKKETACNNLKKAKVVYNTKLEANIGPKTRKRILSFKCDFSFF